MFYFNLISLAGLLHQKNSKEFKIQYGLYEYWGAQPRYLHVAVYLPQVLVSDGQGWTIITRDRTECSQMITFTILRQNLYSLLIYSIFESVRKKSLYLRELEQVHVEEWRNIPKRFTINYVASIRKRCVPLLEPWEHTQGISLSNLWYSWRLRLLLSLVVWCWDWILKWCF